jgi:hypothetical protein
MKGYRLRFWTHQSGAEAAANQVFLPSVPMMHFRNGLLMVGWPPGLSRPHTPNDFDFPLKGHPVIADQGTKKISPFDEMENPRVIEAERITRDDLLALAHGEAIAIVVRDYCPQDLCARATQQLLHDSLYGEYANVPGVHKWGLNTYEGLSSKEREQHYFSEAVAAVQSLRDAWAPYLSPIDRLRLELQEGWPGGANMEHLEGNPLFVGQARVFTEGKGAIPHQDFLSWELEDLRREDRSDGKAELLTQMTANLYLQTADEGGENCGRAVTNTRSTTFCALPRTATGSTAT